jgi:glucose-1-phosphate cytidylyltransferase
MKVVILAGGLGTRLSEYTGLIPKPMVEIGGKPMLWHILNIYSSYGYNEFVIALGYKSQVIKEYFLHYYALNSDFEVDLSNGDISYVNPLSRNWKITLVDTGLNTLTGGRVKRLQNIIGDESFMLTYGDAVADVNIEELVKFHEKSNKIATVTAVHPVARFGELGINGDNEVLDFKEKPQVNQGWINGGFFVLNPEVFNYIEDDNTILEREPLENLTKENQLVAYKHAGFWQCMDTVRDRDSLEEIWNTGDAAWKIKK